MLLHSNFSIAQNTENNISYPINSSNFQWDLGKILITYNNNELPKKYVLIGNSIDLIGYKIKDKVVLSLGMDYIATTPQNFIPHIDTTTVYRMLELGNFYFRIEKLIKTHKKINFSFPLKFGFGGSTYEYVKSTPNNTSIGTFSDHYIFVSPGANVLVNILRNTSIGFGVSYRYLQPTETPWNKAINNYSASVFLRFKPEKKNDK